MMFKQMKGGKNSSSHHSFSGKETLKNTKTMFFLGEGAVNYSPIFAFLKGLAT